MPVGIVGGIFGIIVLICAVWVIYDVLLNKKKLSSRDRVIWIILALLFDIITAIAYYFIVRKK